MTGAGARPDPVSRLVKALAKDQDFTSVEIAETLWLAMQIEPATPPAPDIESEEPSPSPLEAPPDNLDDEPPEFGPEDQDISPPPPPPRANIAAPTPQVGVLPPQTLPVWLADPAMLTDSLAIIRALKPLLKKMDAGIGKHLDETATVETIARTRLVLPVLKAEKEPWFDIVLVVDRGSSMAIWQRLVKDVVRILRRYGAFRDVRVFDLVVNPEAPAEEQVRLVANPQRPGHRPSELIDQQGRRLAIVLSDCAGAYWWDGTLLPMLQDWGKIMPTMIWHMLPPWMWKRTALGRGTAVAISNDIPGVENQQLRVQVQERCAPEDAHQRVAMPVVTSDLKDLTRWSLMLAGDRRELTPGFLLPQQGAVVPRSKTYEAIAEERAKQNVGDEANDEEFQAAYDQALEDLARERVERFVELASPEAQRLIMLLAAAPVITLPVVRLIRDAMLYEARSPLPVAEVFLSGLLQRLPGQDIHQLERQLAQDQEPSSVDPSALGETAGPELSSVVPEAQDLVQYDFAPRVRSVLLEYLPAVDTIEVINSVSAAVERRWNQVSDQDFRAFLTDLNVEVPEELSGLRSFASVTADILEQLGRVEYAQLANRLRNSREEIPLEDSISAFFGEVEINLLRFRQIQEEEDFLKDEDSLELEAFEYEFAEYLNLTPLETFEFIDAQLVDEPEEKAFPLPLQTENFTVVTFEVQESSEADPTLDTEPFEFTVATLERQRVQGGFLDAPQQKMFFGGEQWVIQRRRKRAYRFIESLPGNITLEMVAISRGNFLMGSPDNEPEHYDRESPQHNVNVAPFFIGQYPINQAQWRIVAGLPKIEKDLRADPSNHKGGKYPVEQVSWSDAIEFCARLSVLTGKAYRLPSEAEWEYACRAGTPTPFHFGETISSEVANYKGDNAYADGPTGESRNETTNIKHFECANAFGLSDMHGNVWEWCQDHWHENYEGAPDDSKAWEVKPNSFAKPLRGGSRRSYIYEAQGDSNLRVIRGGSWFDLPKYCRSAYRRHASPDDIFISLGFRVCCSGLPIKDSGYEKPRELKSNIGKSFVGSSLMGLGFLFDDSNPAASSIEEMNRLIRKNPKNSERIFPYINGRDINESPNVSYSRHVINFEKLSENEAWQWPDLMMILESRVKPERLRSKRNILARNWWQIGRLNSELYRAVEGLENILAISRTSKHLAFVRIPTGVIYSDRLVVFPFERYAAFSILQSKIHECWARAFSSSLKDMILYSPSDCFETFPFPENWETDSSIEEIGRAYYKFRADLMVRNEQGLTSIYNRFHSPAENDSDIFQLRSLQEQMDCAVLRAYGWGDIEVSYGFTVKIIKGDLETLPSELQSRIVSEEIFFSNLDDAVTFDSLIYANGWKVLWHYQWHEQVHDAVMTRLLALNEARSEEE